MRDGRLRVAPGDRHPAAGAGHGGAQPVVVHGGNDVGQPLDGSGGRIPITRGDVGGDEEVEGAGEVCAVIGETMESLLEIAARRRCVAPGQQQRRQRQGLFGFGLDPRSEVGQQLLRLLEATLAARRSARRISALVCNPGQAPSVIRRPAPSSRSASSHLPLAASTLP